MDPEVVVDGGQNVSVSDSTHSTLNYNDPGDIIRVDVAGIGVVNALPLRLCNVLCESEGFLVLQFAQDVMSAVVDNHVALIEAPIERKALSVLVVVFPHVGDEVCFPFGSLALTRVAHLPIHSASATAVRITPRNVMATPE